jgi:hypothetical protein
VFAGNQVGVSRQPGSRQLAFERVFQQALAQGA